MLFIVTYVAKPRSSRLVERFARDCGRISDNLESRDMLQHS